MEINKSVVARVSDLPKMELQEVKDLWLELYKEPPPRSPRSFLVKKLAYRLQELAYGISPDIEVRVEQAVKEHFSSGGSAQKKPKSYNCPMVGTRLIREYRGVEYQVSVLEEGYEYQGCTYSSLSKIARHITGAAWSGPAFFGLKQPKGGRR